MTQSEQKSFLSRVKKETGIEYYGVTGKRPVSVGEVITHVSSSNLPLITKQVYTTEPITYTTEPTSYKPIYNVIESPIVTTYKTPPTTYKIPPTTYKEVPIIKPPKYPIKEPSIYKPPHSPPPYTLPPTTYKIPPTTYKTPPTKKPPIIPYLPKQRKYPKQKFRKFKVFGRRFGKWKQVGIAKDPLGAIGIGKQWARKTLGVTFKVPKYKGTKVKGFRTKKEKEGYVFIEPKGKRIKKKGTSKEFSELVYWKKVKSPITKKKVKGGKK